MNLLVFNIRTDTEHPTQGVTTRWLNALSIYFDNIYVLTMHKGRLSLENNIKVYSIDRNGNQTKIKKIYAFYKLFFSILKNKKVDACFTHMATLLLVLGGPILFIKRIPMITWYAHSVINPKMIGAFILSNAIVTASHDSFRIKSKKVHVTGHGIDTEHYSFKKKICNDLFIIGSVGRISRIKNYETLICALQLLIKQGITSFHVKLYGNIQTNDDKEYYIYLMDLIKKNTLKDKIEFAGPISGDQVPEVVSTFDVFVNMLSKGGAGKAVLEAMSIGVPTIICTNAFNQFLQKTEIETLLFKANDAQSLMTKIQGLMMMSIKDRINLGVRLRQLVVHHHSLKNLTKKISIIAKRLQRI